MWRGPLPYGHAGATRIFSDSAGSFAARRRAKDHTNECEEQRDGRGGSAGEREPRAGARVLPGGGDGNVDVRARNARVRDDGLGGTMSATRRRPAVTSDVGSAGGGGRRDEAEGEAARRGDGRPGGSRRDGRGDMTTVPRRRNDQRRFGG
jgi:hypothetical protein